MVLVTANTLSVHAPIGVFDSGVGGLSVLQALHLELPGENFVYVADTANAPYGERDEAFLRLRVMAIAQYFIHDAAQPIKALVVACNTATAVAIAALRATYPAFPIIGVEPALKTALACSRSAHIAVMATRATLNSTKFQTLLNAHSAQASFICQPCDGLAAAIEQDDAARVQSLCERYTQAIGIGRPISNPDTSPIDTVVLGCTHYPFAKQVLQDLLGPDVSLIDTGAPVARQTKRLLGAHCASPDAGGTTRLMATGQAQDLRAASLRWLGLNTPVQNLAV